MPPGKITVGQISVNGKAIINGAGAIGGESVFSGDRVVTQGGSMASVSVAGGNEVVLGELTSVQIKHEGERISVALDRGRLECLSAAAPPIVVVARGTKIVPGKGGGLYVIELAGDSLRVTAKKGDAELESANGTVRIAEGKSLVATVETTVHSAGRIVRYVIMAAGIGAGAGLALVLTRTNSGCTVSSSNVGNCASPP
ncbi:MAG: hypothetical protein ACYDCD_05115 [Candidatus Acidiferrales bacterium]